MLSSNRSALVCASASVALRRVARASQRKTRPQRILGRAFLGGWIRPGNCLQPACPIRHELLVQPQDGGVRRHGDAVPDGHLTALHYFARFEGFHGGAQHVRNMLGGEVLAGGGQRPPKPGTEKLCPCPPLPISPRRKPCPTRSARTEWWRPWGLPQGYGSAQYPRRLLRRRRARRSIR